MQGGGLEEPNMLVPVAAHNYPGLHVPLTYLFSHPFYWFCTFSHNQDDFTRSIQPSVGKSGKEFWMLKSHGCFPRPQIGFLVDAATRITDKTMCAARG